MLNFIDRLFNFHMARPSVTTKIVISIYINLSSSIVRHLNNHVIKITKLSVRRTDRRSGKAIVLSPRRINKRIFFRCSKMRIQFFRCHNSVKECSYHKMLLERARRIIGFENRLFREIEDTEKQK